MTDSNATMTEYTYTPETSPFYLAALADCDAPGTRESAGASFLMSVAEDVRERVEYDSDRTEDRSDLVHEIADGAVPVYTVEMWETFVDLAAWQEDPTELGHDGSDMHKNAQVCLYQIAARLATALLEDEAEQYEDWNWDGEQA